MDNIFGFTIPKPIKNVNATPKSVRKIIFLLRLHFLSLALFILAEAADFHFDYPTEFNPNISFFVQKKWPVLALSRA